MRLMNLCFWFAIVRIVVCFRATFEMAAYVINKEFLCFSLKCFSCSLIHRTFYYSLTVLNSTECMCVCRLPDHCQEFCSVTIPQIVKFITSVYVYNMFYVYIVMGKCHMPVCLVTSTFTQS